MRKAQLFSLESILSIVLFIIVILFLLSFWNLYSSRLSSQIHSEELQLQAAQVTDILVSSRGYPDAWEADPASVVIPGLMLNPGSLDEQKLNQFLALDYETLKQLLNIERFDIAFELRDVSGNVLENRGNISSTADEAVVFQRLMLLKNQTRQVYVALWE
ncbi:MAG TPA: hypothetical protein VJH88_00715 [Candidatus Nanoarchaeia archaeon]|nr:hypothetical protein [Candidatus Nanoarchaeia archaeon]